MQFTKLVSTTALAASALGHKIMLYTNDVNEILFNHAGLSGVHEGAALDYYVVGTSADVLEYDETTGQIYQDFSANKYHDAFRLYLNYIKNTEVYKGFPFLKLSGETPTHKWTLDQHNVLKVDGGEEKFYAAQHVNDPYNYPNVFFVGVGDENVFADKVTDLHEIYITADFVAVL